jgi:hypothetical protein
LHREHTHKEEGLFLLEDQVHLERQHHKGHGIHRTTQDLVGGDHPFSRPLKLLRRVGARLGEGGLMMT